MDVCVAFPELINYSRGNLPLGSDSQENPDVDMVKPRRRLFHMKIETCKENSGQPPCLSLCPGAANDQTKASRRER